MLHYAETHFRFPISRLYRKEPVILIDAPFQVCLGSHCPVWLVLRNANRFNVFIDEIYGEWKNANEESISFKLPIKKQFCDKFSFEELDFEKPKTFGFWQLRVFIKYKTNKKSKVCERWNYPFLEAKPLIIHFLKEEIPKPNGWLAGETHCHSSYTSDSVEFGAAPYMLQKAAKSVGLDFVCITDHSYDLINEKKFNKLKELIAELNKNDLPLLLCGEEVSCGNLKNENVHLLTFANENYIEGHGDGGRRWWNTKPDLTIANACKDTICFAAHPKLQMLLAEKLLLKRGHWSFKDLTENKIYGVEFWNGYRGKDFYEGKELWIECLLNGFKLLPIGGNDAHGDLNSYTAVKKPLWSLKHNREHIFGQVRTVIPPTSGVPFDEIPKNLYITDGPALWFELLEDKKLVLKARSTEDFGTFLSITVFYANVKEKKERTEQLDLKINCFEYNFEIDFRNSYYVRAECESSYGKFAMTAPIYSHPVQ